MLKHYTGHIRKTDELVHPDIASHFNYFRNLIHQLVDVNGNKIFTQKVVYQ